MSALTADTSATSDVDGPTVKYEHFGVGVYPYERTPSVGFDAARNAIYRSTRHTHTTRSREAAKRHARRSAGIF